MYSEAVLDHFQNPRNVGTLDTATATISVENPVCGDILELSARMGDGTRVFFFIDGIVAGQKSG